MLLTAVGGALGAVARWGLEDAFPAHGTAFPWTTFAINVVGSGLLALLGATPAVRRRPALPVFLGTGVLGGFTTMSAASVDTVRLLDGGAVSTGLLYVCGTLAAALAAGGGSGPARPHWAGRVRGRGGRPVTVLLVVAGAAVGAPLRFVLGRLLDRGIHWGTLAVNLAGAALLGALVGAGVPAPVLALIGTGFCGGLTTYSSFAVQTVDARRRPAVAYVVMTIVGCTATAALGDLLGSGPDLASTACPASSCTTCVWCR